MRITWMLALALATGCVNVPPPQAGGPSADACVPACADGDAQCQTYTYAALRKLCWVRNVSTWLVAATGISAPARRAHEVNVDRSGSDYRSFSDASLEPASCEAACAKERECQAWSYDGRDGQTPTCNLKNDVPDKTPALDMVSGVKRVAMP